MYRRALLVALIVCSMGVLFAAVQPASAGSLSETLMPDGTEDDPEEDDGWHSGWGDDDDHRTEHGDDRDGSDGGDADGASNDGDQEDARGEENSSDGEDGPAEDDDRGGIDRQNGTQRENDTGETRETTDDETDDGDARNRTRSLTGRVLGLTNETVRSVTDGVAGDLDGDGDPDVELVDVDDGSVRVGGLTGGSSDGAAGSDRGVEVLEVELDDDLLDDRGRLRAGNVTVGGVLVVPLDPPEILAADGADEGPDGRPAPDAPTASDAMAESTPSDEPASVTVAGSEPSPSEDTEGTGNGSVESADADDQGGAGGSPGSGAGAGAALVVTVGFLGGTRTALDQTALLASQGSGTTLTTLRHAVAGHLDELPGGALPALFGYSRHDSSDPLENETRAQIYDVVRESPGTYHAQLAEETGVAVETVRYHSRILAEEGLVEARKIRGRRRLFPVTMDDDDPELAAAIADSAASDVLSVIERLEPTTLSAIAETVDCAPSTVSYHVDRLEDDGLVTRERDGGAVRVRLRRSTRSALQGRVADD